MQAKSKELLVVLVSALGSLVVAVEVVAEVGQDATLPAAKDYFAPSAALVADSISGSVKFNDFCL